MLTYDTNAESDVVIEWKNEISQVYSSIDNAQIVDAGNYTVRVRFIENDNYLSTDLLDNNFVKQFRILPMSPSVVLNNNLSKQYDGLPIDQPDYLLQNSYQVKNAIFQYKSVDQGDGEYSTVRPNNVGKYVLRINIEGVNANFADSFAEFPFEISDEDIILDKEYVGMITGSTNKHYQNLINDTQADGDVRGADLGYPVWDPVRNRLLLFFGDTVGEWTEDTAPTSNKAGHKDWRNNVMMVSTDDDYSDGLTVTGYLTYDGIQPTGHAIEVIKGHKDNDKSAVYRERSKLPTGTIEIDGTIYMTYMSKYKWGFSIDSINYGGFVKSEDGGVTWSRVNDLSWANHASGNGSEFGDGTRGLDANLIEELMNENINRELTITPDDPDWISVADHEGYFFTTINPVDGKDGYIYIFGEGSFRSTGVKLGRVKRENFEDFSAYEYLQGYYENNAPIWLSYKEGGLHNLNSKEAQLGFALGDNTTGAYTTTVMYNKYLGKWVLSSASRTKGGIFWALSDNVWGPYDYDSAIVALSFADAYMLERNENGSINSSIYCGYIDEHLTEDDGRIMYMVVSQFSPIYESSLVKITLGKKSTDNVVKHIIPLAEMDFLSPKDESRILAFNGEDYYCIHETTSFTAAREEFRDTISSETNVNLNGFVANSCVGNQFIIYRRKLIINIEGSTISVFDGENEIENDGIAWIGYRYNPETNKVGLKSGELVIGQNIYYNKARNYVFFGCAEGYSITHVTVYKAGDEVNVSFSKPNDDDTLWRYLPASTVHTYRFELTVLKNE